MSSFYSYEQLTDSVELLERRPPRFITWFLLFLLCFAGAFLVWAYFGTVEIVSRGTAVVQSERYKNAIKSQTGGVVEAVLVQPGTRVRKGDPLVKIKNRELDRKLRQIDSAVKSLEVQRAALTQLKTSIETHLASLSDAAYAVVFVAERIHSIEQELVEKRQESLALRRLNDSGIIKAQTDGIVHFPAAWQPGDPVQPGQEVASVVREGAGKKVKIFVSPEELNGVKEGDQVRFSFQTGRFAKLTGTVTYIAPAPFFDADSKTFIYELEATVNTPEEGQLIEGMTGRASIVKGSESVLTFILRKWMGAN